MRQVLIVLIVCVAGVLAMNQIISAQSSHRAIEVEVQSIATPSNLAIVWTSADPDVAHRMVLMYTNASKKNGWFDNVRLVVWGPSQRLLVGDKDIQAYVQRLRETGVIVEACQACSDSYGITETLREMDIEVKYMGVPLSDFLKNAQWEVMTF